MRKAFFLLIILTFLFISNNSVFAHPGRTAADGCHYCRTNCDKWGVPWDERHCHGGGAVQGIQEQKPIYTPPTSIPRPLPTWTSTPTYNPVRTTKPKNSIKIVTEPTRKKTFWQWLFGR